MVVGIDVSKKTLVGVVLNRATHEVCSFTIENTKDEIHQLLSSLMIKYKRLLVVSEATAEYHRVLALECIDQGITFKLLNPILTKQFTRATIRKKKTDASDAVTIARLGL